MRLFVGRGIFGERRWSPAICVRENQSCDLESRTGMGARAQYCAGRAGFQPGCLRRWDSRYGGYVGGFGYFSFGFSYWGLVIRYKCRGVVRVECVRGPLIQ